MNFFKRVINLCKQINYSEFKSEKYYEYMKQLDELVATKSK
jgi:V/A-type H+-transporting ATPase subunit A